MPAPEQITESLVLDLLERKHAKSGNGGSGEYAFLRHLRNDAGFDARRTFDGAAVSLWPSRGFELHIFEVKVSRSDWLRELKDPVKAEVACQVAERFTMVAPKGVIQPEEIPSTWGYIEVSSTGQSLRTVKAAPLLHEKARRTTFPAGLVISMLRAVGAVPDGHTVEEKRLAEEYSRGYQEAREMERASVERATDMLRDHTAAVRRFTLHSGVQVVPTAGWDQGRIDEVAQRIKVAFADAHHTDAVKARLQLLVDNLERATDEVRRVLRAAEVSGE